MKLLGEYRARALFEPEMAVDIGSVAILVQVNGEDCVIMADGDGTAIIEKFDRRASNWLMRYSPS